MNIPFVHLKRQHSKIRSILQQTFSQVLDSGQVMGGKIISAFEKDFSTFVGVPYGIACANGTDALEIILRAMGIGEGDEVIVPANGFIAAAEATLLLGATPVFTEPHPLYYTLDPAEVKKKITAKTKAIVPVHLYGLPAPMPEIVELAEQYHLQVIEDGAQAHGAGIGAQKAGSFGDAAAFSFYPTKNLGALGDAGMIVTHHPDLAEKCRILANHGQTKRNVHRLLGRNSRMDTLQAAVLQAKLPHLQAWNERRRTIASYYQERWKELDIILPEEHANYCHVYHLFVIQTEKRDALAQYLQSQGITTEIHYPHALPFMEVFQSLHPAAYDFPVAAQQAHRLLSIPVYPELTDAEVEYIADKVKEGIRYVRQQR